MRALGLTCLALGMAALAACQVLPAPVAVGGPAASGAVQVEGRVALQAPKAPQVGFRLMDWDLPVPLGAEQVAWVQLHLTHLNGSGTEVDLGRLPGADAPVVLRNLRPSSQYALRLEAMDAEMARIEDPATGCVTFFSTDESPLATGLQFGLKLKDSVFVAKREVALGLVPGQVDQPDPAGPAFDSRDVNTVQAGPELGAYGYPILLNLGTPEGFVLANIDGQSGPSNATQYVLRFLNGVPTKLACHASGNTVTVTLDSGTLLTSPYRVGHYGNAIYFLQALNLVAHDQNLGNSYFCGNP